MDTQFDSQLQSLTGPELPATVRAGRVRSLIEGLARRQRHRARRSVRLASLSPWRVTQLFVLACLLAMASGAFLVWRAHQQGAVDAARSELAFVEARLDAIAQAFDRLDGELGKPKREGLCTPQVAQVLARASIGSELVQRFQVAARGAEKACFPEGPGVPSLPAQFSSPQLAVYSSQQIALQLMVLRDGTAGRLLGAALDPRVFDRAATSSLRQARLPAVHTVLMSADGRRLVDLAGPALDGPAVLQLRSVARSQHYGAMVYADVSRAGLASALIERLIVSGVLACLLVLVFLLLVWRVTMLRALPSSRIERGLRKRQFEPYVQPIVNMTTGRCAGGEILMRWAHPDRGVLGPAEFIAEAERSRLIVGMSDLVMERAAQRLAKLAAEQPELYFSFNITPLQLRQAGFERRLAELFHRGTLPRAQVLLELTEREYAGQAGASAMTALHDAGWKLAIDDFGTGQSSLAMVEQLPVNRIKIDLSFVRAIGEQTVTRPVLDAIIALAEQLKVPLIAEGVETEAQWDYLVKRGVQYAQGYLVARPMPIEVFLQWLASQQTAPPGPRTDAVPETGGSMPFVDAEARQLWQRMGSDGGLDIRDRLYRLRRYGNCFIGRDAVDWIVRQLDVSRADAVAIGKRLAALGLLEHVLHEHDFADAELYYRLVPGAAGGVTTPLMGPDLIAATSDLSGLEVRDHCRGLVLHRQCAPGHQIVDWICRTGSVSRPIARQWGAELMRRGTLRHVFDDQPFRDDRSLYRFA